MLTIKDKMRKAFLLCTVIACSLRVSPQQNQILKSTPGLNIGDTVPDILLSGLVNYPVKTARLSDFRGKHIIIDFWSTWCGACIHLFPELDSLQKKYKSDLVILAVTSQKEEIVQPFLNKNIYAKALPFA